MRQEIAPTASTDLRFAAAACLIKNGYAAMSREDKAAFGIDTWDTRTDTPEELQARVAAWIDALAHSFVPQGLKRVLVRIPFSTEVVTADVPQALESKDEILDWILSNTANAISGVALSSKTA